MFIIQSCHLGHRWGIKSKMKIAFINYFDVKQRQIFVEIALLIHVKNAPPASMLTNNSLYFHFFRILIQVSFGPELILGAWFVVCLWSVCLSARSVVWYINLITYLAWRNGFDEVRVHRQSCFAWRHRMRNFLNFKFTLIKAWASLWDVLSQTHQSLSYNSCSSVKMSLTREASKRKNVK